MRRTDAPPTMKDVAREAGVSIGTVSKVINGIPVGESYRRRVEAAIRALGYHVNTYARGLKTNKTNCVALVMPSLRHPFFAHLTDELAACLMRRGYRSLLMITDFDPEAEQKCFDMVRQNKADGVIALTYSPDLETGDDLPIVTIDRISCCLSAAKSSSSCASARRSGAKRTAAARALSTSAASTARITRA